LAKFKQNRQSHVMLLPPSIDDFIPESHFARVVSSIVDKLNTNSIENKYSHLGQNTYHPKILLKILFYGYATGSRSGRKLAGLCEVDCAFMYLSQMYRPDFRTINDFRKNNAFEIEGFFVDVVKVCAGLGMVKVGAISIDGSKIRANASAKRTKDRQGYEKWLEKLEGEIKQILKEADEVDAKEDDLYGDNRGDELPKEIRKKHALKEKIEEILKDFDDRNPKINLTDPDANFMKAPKSAIDTAYNGQIAVTDNQIIVAADVSKSANDRGELSKMIEQTEDGLDIEINQILADSGYSSCDNYEYLARREKDAYIPDQYFEKVKQKAYEDEKNKYHLENFIFDKQNSCYICPEGKTLKYHKKRITKQAKIKRNQAIYKGNDCLNCKVKHLCTKSKQRTISRDLREDLVLAMREKLLSSEGQQIYRRRLYTVEPPFAHLKYNLGYKTFLLRSIKKVRAEFKLMCIGYNLRKIWSFKTTVAAA